MTILTKEPKNVRSCAKPLAFTVSARAAFRHLLRHFALNQGTRELVVPGYIGYSAFEGSGVYDPIVETRTPHSFCPVRPDLSMDLGWLEQRLKTGQVHSVLVIHYFGFVQHAMEAVVDLCHRHGARVIEDCAHTMDSPVGHFGDYTLYSIHKLFATDHGGILRVNTDELDLLDRIGDADRIRSTALAQYARTDRALTSETRIRNFQFLANHAASFSKLCAPMYPSLPAGTVPLNFPVLVHGGKREALYKALVARDCVPVSLYHTLIPALHEHADFSTARSISKSILNFPVHQDTTTQALERLVETLTAIQHEGL